MEDPPGQWRRQIHSHLLAEGPLLFVHVAAVVKRPPGITKFTHKLLDVVVDDPRFEITGSGNAMTLSAVPLRVLAHPAAAAPDPQPVMDDLAEDWRRRIHAGLLSEGPQLFLHVGKLARRPPGFSQKLQDVVRADPRFVVTGSGHAMELSAAAAPGRVPARPSVAKPAAPSLAPHPQHPGREACPFYMKTGTCSYGEQCRFDHPLSAAAPARRVLARPAAAASAAPSPAPYAEHPKREACDSYTRTGSCPFGEKCHFDHPPKVDAVRTGTSAWGAPRVEAPEPAVAGAREAAPVSRGGGSALS